VAIAEDPPGQVETDPAVRGVAAADPPDLLFDHRASVKVGDATAGVPQRFWHGSAILAWASGGPLSN